MRSLTAEAILLLSLSTIQTYASSQPETNFAGFARAGPPSCSYVAVSPSPPGLICGEKGTIKTPSVISTKNTDMTTCLNSCMAAQTCLTFSYGPGRTCTLYSKPLQGAGQGYQANPTSRSMFYNRRCFKQSCVCPVPSQTICSGSCIDTASDPANCGGCKKQISSSSNACCSGTGVNTTSDVNNCGSCGTKIAQGDNACCSSKSVNTNTDSNNCGACGQAINPLTDDACCAGKGVNTQTSNTNCGKCGTVCQGTSVCTLGVCKAPPVCVPVDGPQLLANPNFDDNYKGDQDDAPWALTGATAKFVNEPANAQSGNIDVAFLFLPPVISSSVYQDLTTLVQGQAYTVSTYYKFSKIYANGSNKTAVCTLDVNLAGQTIGSQTFSTADLSATTYSQYKNENVVYNGATGASARLEVAYSCPDELIGPMGSAYFRVDTVSITANLQSCT